MNVKYIFSLKLAAYLMNSGCPIKGVRPNAKIKGKDVYVFEDCEKVNLLIKQYQNNNCTKEE